MKSIPTENVSNLFIYPNMEKFDSSVRQSEVSRQFCALHWWLKGPKSNLINPYKRSNSLGVAPFKSIRKIRQLPKALIPLFLAFYFIQPRRKAGNFTFGSTGRYKFIWAQKDVLGQEEESVANKRQISVTRPRIVLFELQRRKACCSLPHRIHIHLCAAAALTREIKWPQCALSKSAARNEGRTTLESNLRVSEEV